MAATIALSVAAVFVLVGTVIRCCGCPTVALANAPWRHTDADLASGDDVDVETALVYVPFLRGQRAGGMRRPASADATRVVRGAVSWAERDGSPPQRPPAVRAGEDVPVPQYL